VADTRTCEQCGIVFTPRREHARFCSAACRVAWNQEHTGNPQAGASALDWSVTAMRDAVERLATEQAPDQARGFEMISDAVWRVTLVDATLVRYHPRAYEAVMRAQGPAARRTVEQTLAGLRFVRNRMGYHDDPAEFIEPGHGGPGIAAGPGVPGAARRSHHRRYFRPGRRVRQAGLQQSSRCLTGRPALGSATSQ
jgi:hypothetical protein